jgi:hypothetical protein
MDSGRSSDQQQGYGYPGLFLPDNTGIEPQPPVLSRILSFGL